MSFPVAITYFDTAMALLEIGSLRLLTDPVLDPAGSRFEYGPIVLEKSSARAVALKALGRIDAVLLSHDQHADNLDDAGRALLPSVGCVLTTTEGAARLGATNITGLAPWEGYLLPGNNGDLAITALPAQHGPDGTQEATGTVTGFLLGGPAVGGKNIYISGDTIRFPGTAEIARRFAPVDLALLNLGRVRLGPMGDLEFSLSAREALVYADELQARRVVALHFEGWKHFSEDPASGEAVLENGLGQRLFWPRPGVRQVFEL